jgi:N-acetyl-gamma-glutamyl-phosphate/LysW-gamma-L-alpha-aminoadipyl-6-phosphate reductase
VGGELLRLLLDHPEVELVQATSDSAKGELVAHVHPNLRGATQLRFAPHVRLKRVDVAFVALPRGRTAAAIDLLERQAETVVDLGPDFRLSDPVEYSRHYGEHPRPDLLGAFVCGLPELYRERLRGATRIATPGCIATASILALGPLAEQGLVDGTTILDARTGSSGSGARPNRASHHADRSGVVRVYRPAGHRHEAEVAQATGVRTRMTVSAVEAVRGLQVVAHVTPARPVAEPDLWRVYRDRYADEPFVRVVRERRGLYRLPEPKVLSGSNFCDLGFAVDPDGGRFVAIGALDNLVKGAAGNAVQSFNVARGFPERTALGFRGLHPV